MKVADHSWNNSRRITVVVFLALVGVFAWDFGAGASQGPRERGVSAGELDRAFSRDVRPFLDKYCVSCHGANGRAAQFDLRPYSGAASRDA